MFVVAASVVAITAALVLVLVVLALVVVMTVTASVVIGDAVVALRTSSTKSVIKRVYKINKRWRYYHKYQSIVFSFILTL